MISLDRMRRTSHRQIVRFGSGPGNANARGYLVRDGVRRACTVAVIDYSNNEKGVRLEGARRALISALHLSEPPDFERDMLEAAGELFRIVRPPSGQAPSGGFMHYDCEVVNASRPT